MIEKLELSDKDFKQPFKKKNLNEQLQADLNKKVKRLHKEIEVSEKK